MERLISMQSAAEMAVSRQTADAAQITDLINGINTGYMMIAAVLVFIMQLGFAMLTAGSIRTKNVKAVLMMNCCDLMVGTVAFYLVGYAFAFGGTSNGFIGYSNFALSDMDLGAQGIFFTFELFFAAAACTIVSGPLAERVNFAGYLSYAFFIISFVYCVPAHWIWTSTGWLSAYVVPEGSDTFRLFGQGAIDFAGCITVHMVGGFTGLIGCIIIGPRVGRFDMNGQVVPMPGHSATLVALGTFLLWFGWFGFNAGSVLALAVDTSAIPTITLSDGSTTTINLSAAAQRAVMNTAIAPAVAGIVSLALVRFLDKTNDINTCLNGCLAGCVGITSSCSLVEPYAAAVIGIIAAILYVFSARILLVFGLDDPLDAFALHGVSGLWGNFAAGLFSREQYQAEAGFMIRSWGAFYGGGGRLLAANIVAEWVTIAWIAVLMTPFFLLLKFLGIFRVAEEEEIIGQDFAAHGGAAYAENVIQVEKEEEVVRTKPVNMVLMEQEMSAQEATKNGNPASVVSSNSSDT